MTLMEWLLLIYAVCATVAINVERARDDRELRRERVRRGYGRVA